MGIHNAPRELLETVGKKKGKRGRESEEQKAASEIAGGDGGRLEWRIRGRARREGDWGRFGIGCNPKLNGDREGKLRRQSGKLYGR